MRIQQLAAGLGLIALFAAQTAAQEPEPKKPGGLNKVARNISKTSKKAGTDVKREVKNASSDAHQVLTKAGNDTKAEAKRATNYAPPDPNKKPGGLNKLARDVSKASKKAGSDVKWAVKGGKSSTHAVITDAGNASKDTLKKIKPPIE
jgi:ElaB/YqjD/DUF883 family membrane-anchored ribosome-binding protein